MASRPSRSAAHAPRKPSRFPPGFALSGKPRAVLRGLLDEPIVGHAELVAKVDQYLAHIEARAQNEEFVDVALAGQLAGCAKALLNTLAPETPEDILRLAHAAIRYFLLEHDGESDVASPIGFDDDRDVLNAVARQLGREDLLLETP